jgi:hypothetical protein
VLLRRFVVVGVIALTPASAINPIAVENARPGTTAWSAPATAFGDIYASEVSARAGDALHFHVSTQPGVRYRIEVFRLGWYHDAGARLVGCTPACGGDKQGVQQPQPGVPPADPFAPAIRAAWPVTDTLPTSRTWVSGYYLARVVINAGAAAGPAGATVVILRPYRAHARAILVQVPVNTWQAYNTWGGKSLYDDILPRSYHVSFDRPYAESPPTLRELPLVRFLERSGYAVDYQTDLDTDARPLSLQRHPLVIVVGHDEYWTKTIRDAFESALASGTNLVFLGANIGFWQMRYDDASGAPAIDEYRSAAQDPSADPATKTTRFRRLEPPRRECALLGVEYDGGLGGTFDYRAVDTSSAWFRDTGLSPGDVLPGLVGGEWDTYDPACAPAGTTVLFHGDASPLAADAVTYSAPSGARVFSAGSLAFTQGLDELGGTADPRLERFVRNVLDDLSAPPAGRAHAG